MTSASEAELRIVPYGERAWLVQLGDTIDEAINARIVAIADAIDERRRLGLDAVARPIVAYASLLVAYEPSRIAADDVRTLLVDVSTDVAPPVGPDEGRLIEIPVRYGGDGGPDLEDVAERLGLSCDAVVAAHTGTTYRVFMLGFAPGFAYLGRLPQELNLPRRSGPRTSVPAGSVAIAARQTAVYPVATPCGWNLIGHTDLPLWDLASDPPARLAPGDRVRFVAS